MSEETKAATELAASIGSLDFGEGYVDPSPAEAISALKSPKRASEDMANGKEPEVISPETVQPKSTSSINAEEELETPKGETETDEIEEGFDEVVDDAGETGEEDTDVESEPELKPEPKVESSELDGLKEQIESLKTLLNQQVGNKDLIPAQASSAATFSDDDIQAVLAGDKEPLVQYISNVIAQAEQNQTTQMAIQMERQLQGFQNIQTFFGRNENQDIAGLQDFVTSRAVALQEGGIKVDSGLELLQKAAESVRTQLKITATPKLHPVTKKPLPVGRAKARKQIKKQQFASKTTSRGPIAKPDKKTQNDISKQIAAMADLDLE